jgi:hypothetical protein
VKCPNCPKVGSCWIALWITCFLICWLCGNKCVVPNDTLVAANGSNYVCSRPSGLTLWWMCLLQNTRTSTWVPQPVYYLGHLPVGGLPDPSTTNFLKIFSSGLLLAFLYTNFSAPLTCEPGTLSNPWTNAIVNVIQ